MSFIQFKGEFLTRITALENGIFKVETIAEKEIKHRSITVSQETVNVNAKADGNKISNGDYVLNFNEDNCTIEVEKKDGTKVYCEKAKSFEKVQVETKKRLIPTEFLPELKDNNNALLYSVTFDTDADEELYGLGSNRNSELKINNEHIRLYQHNIILPVPFFMSSKGFGVFFDEYSIMEFEGELKKYTVDCSLQPTYYIICNDKFDEIIKTFRILTGGVSLMPKWAFGYVQSKEHYKTAKKLTEISNRLKAEKIPTGVVVQDWMYWGLGVWGGKKISKLYGNAKKMVDAVHENGHRTIISVWPKVYGLSMEFVEFLLRGQLLKGFNYNAFDEKARKVYYRQLKNKILEKGFDGLWTDCSEPFEKDSRMIDPTPAESAAKTQGIFRGAFDRRFINAFTYFHNTHITNNLKRDYPEKRKLILTRANHVGLQNKNVFVWTGDIGSSFEELETQIKCILNYVMSGDPYITYDIGGFFVKRSERHWFGHGKYQIGLEDKAYQEMYVRWLQAGTFLPMMRSHGTDFAREPWLFEKPYQDIIREQISIRESLIPYIYSSAYMISQGEKGLVRPLVFDYQNDENLKNCSNEFMFGDSILVAPIMKAMYYDIGNKPIEVEETAQVYLPEGNWYDFYTNEKFKGNKTYTVKASLETIPTFVKENSIIPFKEDENSIKLKIYGKGKKEYTYYDDDGETYEYENGKYTLMKITSSKEEFKLDQIDGNLKFDKKVTAEFIK